MDKGTTIVGDSSHISDAIIEPEEPNTDTNFHVARSVVGPNNGTIATCETLPYGSYQSEPPERNIVATTNKDDPEKIFSILPNHLEDLFVASSRELSEEQTLQLKNLLIRHSDAFAKSKNDLGCCDLIEHTIDTGDARPVKQNPRRLPLAKREAADQEIKRMLEGGIIEPRKQEQRNTEKDDIEHVGVTKRATQEPEIFGTEEVDLEDSFEWVQSRSPEKISTAQQGNTV
ncbi:unnamed protein product [Mytilus edulis]|uniref:Uncharacterized protein n=1 Tax=Mytilus edulis TaxID=6550 RepID=A0A8S3RX21_MYTED|nr:unnamed protein product [Mytilus edulis]